MKKHLKKLIGVMGTIVVMTSVVSGCAKTTTPATQEPEKQESTTSSKPTSQEEKVIVFNGPDEWVRSQLQSTKDGYQKVVEKFEQENPGVKVKLTSEPWGNWQQKLPVVIASGDAPDVFMANGVDALSYYNGGYTADLADMGNEFLDKFYPGALAQYQVGDTVTALPFTTDCRVLWYNKEIFEAAGLDPEKPPTTWDEMRDYALKCSEVTVDGQKVYGFGMDLGLKFPPVASMLAASDFNVFDAETVAPTVNNDTFKKYLQVLVDMKSTYEPDFATLNHEGVATLFGQKKVAMVIAGAWIWSLNEGLSEQDWYGMAATPKMDANSPEGSYAGGWSICVSNQSKNLPEAKKFAEALFDPEYAALLHTDVPPFDEGAAKCDLFNNPKATTFVENMKYGRQLMPPTVSSTEINNVVWEEVSKVIAEKTTIDECINQIETKIKDIIK